MKRVKISMLAAVAVFSACAAQITWGEYATNTTADAGTQIVAPSEELRVTANPETAAALDSIKSELKVMAAQAKAEAEAEAVTVYRLQLHKDGQGNETAYIVGADGVERPVVLISPAKYKMLTERLEAVWQSLHDTSDGRRRLHGKIERTEISEVDGMVTKTEIHSDGYKHRTAAVPKRDTRIVKPTKLEARITEELKPSGMSDKQWEVRKAFRRIKSGKKKTVTVERDAVSGTDTVIPPSPAN